MGRLYGIDLFKLIAAFFIVTLHSGLGLLNIDIIVQIKLLCRWAVPFFFIASGYLLGLKIQNNNKENILINFQRSILNIAGIYIVSIIFYFFFRVFKYDIIYLELDILTGNMCYHLWFLSALLIGLGVVGIFIYFNCKKLLLAVSALVSLLLLFSNSYHYFTGFSLDFDTVRLFSAIPFLSIGIYLVKYKNVTFRYSTLIMVIIGGFFLQYLEAVFFEKYYQFKMALNQMLAGTFVVSTALFLLSKQLVLKDSRLAGFGKKYSLFIYLYHPFALTFQEEFIFNHLRNVKGYVYMFNPILCFTTVLIVGILVDKYWNKLFRISTGKIFKQ